MPNEGTIRHNDNTKLWEVWDDSDNAWLTLNEYFPPSSRAGVSIDAQRDALGKMQGALSGLSIYHVSGTHIGNYEFHMRDPDFIAPSGVGIGDPGYDQPGAVIRLGFDALIRKHAVNVQSGAISSSSIRVTHRTITTSSRVSTTTVSTVGKTSNDSFQTVVPSMFS